jgi:RNA polymerase sigma factor (sigma-70 family)
MPDPRPHPGTSLLTRPSLLLRVRDSGDRAAWDEFHRLYRRLVYGRARRAGLPHADAEDVAQEVFARVAATIADFDTDPRRGSFRGWLTQLTRWRIADRLASRDGLPAPAAPPPPDDSAPRTATLERIPAPDPEDDAWDREWREHLLAAAAERVARQVKPRHFQIFDLYVLQHMSALQVSAALRVNPATVYVVGHRLSKLLQAEVAKLSAHLG